ncbi:hypothetical protein lbkm_3999 [Lachnospiraceae bacterium KM106-2]|nr:hypothetical protein lbkm_3999 [Lachnospiraceae bacterium KM106-2]
MNEKGVVLYGAGRQGLIALEILEREKFHINAIADREAGKECGTFQAISLEELCATGNQEVCIMTPGVELSEVKKRLEKSFKMVLDYSIITWMLYYIPGEREDREYF